jgi:hypothetical protein
VGLREIATSRGGDRLSQAPASVVSMSSITGEVSRFRGVGNLDPHGCAGGIVGEADVAVRLPGKGGDLDGRAGDLDAGPRPGQKLAAREQGGNRQRNNRGPESSNAT